MSFPPAEHAARVERLREATARSGHDWLLVWGEGRDAAGVRYLTGFAPAFELALALVPAAAGEPVVLTGAEGVELFALSGRLGRAEPYLPFSVQGLASARDAPLAEVLRRAGVRRGQRVGLVAERYLPAPAARVAPSGHFVPQLVWAAAVEAVGDARLVDDASALLLAPDGLRARKSARELVALEAAAVRAARALEAMRAHARPGVSERELAHVGMCAAGTTTFAFDTVVAAGARRAASCLDPPGETVLRAGEPVAMYAGPTVDGYCGNVGRLGLLAAGPQDVPPRARDAFARVQRPLAAAYAALLQALRIGVAGARLHAAASGVLREAGLGTLYSPCHLIGLAEWEDTLAQEGCDARVRSGHVLQVDLAVLAEGCPPGRLEDGFAIADGELRAQLRALDEGCWARVEARRRRIAAAGIALDESVLPLSDLAPATHAFLLE